MFERFTDRARRVVVLAQDEARRLNHTHIGTEHLLLGLLREGDGIAARALTTLGVSVEATMRGIDELVPRGSYPPGGHLPFTPRSKKVLELSLREALQLGHNYIGTEHILLGLVREGEGVGAQVLVGAGVSLQGVRAEIVRLLEGGPESEPGPPTESGPAAVGGPIAPARCSFCGTPSPECGALFTNSLQALICEHCVKTAFAAIEADDDPDVPA